MEHALIVSATPERFVRAAAVALQLGFHAVRAIPRPLDACRSASLLVPLLEGAHPRSLPEQQF